MADRELAALRSLARQLRVAPGTKVKLPGYVDPAHTAHLTKRADADVALQAGVRQLADYQARLAAQDMCGLLVVLQGLDASGKDGAIKHVMSGVNPQGVFVHSFKVPSTEELSHDYLWRYARALPARGSIAIFNRSHYEEVLVVRVHPELLVRQHLPAEVLRRGMWQRRFRSICEWERHLVDSGIHVVKIMLHISKQEQRRRLLARIDDADKNWKFDPADLVARDSWDAYMRAYSDALSNTSTAWSPWHVVPADHKWFARAAIAAVIVDALARIDPQYPRLDAAAGEQLAAARALLEAEGG